MFHRNMLVHMNNDNHYDHTPAEPSGFSYRVRKNGEVAVLHHGKLAATLRGTAARDFLTRMQNYDEHEAQQLMARCTGNYKRGNERKARTHPRNRG